EALGASDAMGDEKPQGVTSVAPASASVTVTLVNVTLPEFLTVTVNVTASPALVGAPDFFTFVTSSVAAGTMVTVLESVSVTEPPPGAVAAAVAEFVTDPASTFACVTA